MISNVGNLVDQLMGDEADFDGEVIPAEAVVAVLLPDGTIITLDRLEFEPHPDGTFGGTLWLRGDYA